MQIASTIAALRAARTSLLAARTSPPGAPSPLGSPAATLGLVPTMGALHEGHRSLLRRARQECALVTASVFVNPLQFAPTEDLARYPRTFEADCAMLEAEGVDLLFAPAPGEMYRPGAATTIHVQGLEDRLDGASRPGHFIGVATVVAKLFHIVHPTHAYFGQKDAAQLAFIRKMVRDLNFDLELIACPIVRDPDGLALSSRNRYLSPEERTRALILPRTLDRVAARIVSGMRSSTSLLEEAAAALSAEPGLTLDYVAIVDPDTLLPVPEAVPGSLIALAALIGSTRLIDNLLAP